MKKETEERFMKLAKENIDYDKDRDKMIYSPLMLIRQRLEEKQEEGRISIQSQIDENNLLFPNKSAKP